MISVVIPCYKVSKHIIGLIDKIGDEVGLIYVVDDCCPENSGSLVEASCKDKRVRVIHHDVNEGVGGAVMSGYQAAIIDGAEVIVKIDGDGQMDPSDLLYLIAPILAGEADYTKGNRFFDLEQIHAMPKIRLLGNAVLSFLTKLSSGYWDLFDPTNGYTAIHSDIAKRLPFKKISRRYFFETDMLFRLNTLRAVVVDVPMHAFYGEEVSNLNISAVLWEFFINHIKNFLKRIFYNYYLRDMSLASIELPLGLALIISGSCFGIYNWVSSAQEGISNTAGTVMLAGLPILMGTQLILAFLGYDMINVPHRPLHKMRLIPLSHKERSRL